MERRCTDASVARQPWLDVAPMLQPLVERGNDRRPRFVNHIDQVGYLQEPREHRRVHAFVSMTNPVPLPIILTATGEIARPMQPLGQRQIRYVNGRHRRTGSAPPPASTARASQLRLEKVHSDPASFVLLFSSRLVLRRLQREFPDLQNTRLFRFFESFPSLFDYFVGQILTRVMPLRIDRGIQPLLGCPDTFVNAVKGGMRVRGQRRIVAFRHGVSS